MDVADETCLRGGPGGFLGSRAERRRAANAIRLQLVRVPVVAAIQWCRRHVEGLFRQLDDFARFQIKHLLPAAPACSAVALHSSPPEQRLRLG